MSNLWISKCLITALEIMKQINFLKCYILKLFIDKMKEMLINIVARHYFENGRRCQSYK